MKLFLRILSTASLLMVGGCAVAPKYLEKSSEALSRSTYAVGDSLALGRVELAKQYNESAQKLVPPPKQRIPILPARSGTNSVVTLPESYAGLHSVSAGTEAYRAITRANDEVRVLSSHLAEVEVERQKQGEIHNQLIKDYNTAQITIANQSSIIAKKELALWAHRAVIALILALIGLGIYFKALIPVRLW